jgi:hypothetical protein
MATLKVKNPTKPKTHGSSRYLQYNSTHPNSTPKCYFVTELCFSPSPKLARKTLDKANAEEEELRIQRSSTRLPQSKVCHRAVISAISQTSKKTLDKIKMKQKKESSGFEEAQLYLKVMFLSQSCVLFTISQTSENNMKQANEEEDQRRRRRRADQDSKKLN